MRSAEGAHSYQAGATPQVGRGGGSSAEGAIHGLNRAFSARAGHHPSCGVAPGWDEVAPLALIPSFQSPYCLIVQVLSHPSSAKCSGEHTRPGCWSRRAAGTNFVTLRRRVEMVADADRALESSFWRDAKTNMRDACAPRSTARGAALECGSGDSAPVLLAAQKRQRTGALQKLALLFRGY